MIWKEAAKKHAILTRGDWDQWPASVYFNTNLWIILFDVLAPNEGSKYYWMEGTNLCGWGCIYHSKLELIVNILKTIAYILQSQHQRDQTMASTL